MEGELGPEETPGTSDDPVYPLEQLALIHAECDKELSILSDRMSNLRTRAAILVTASGVVAVIKVSSGTYLWDYFGIGLAVISAVLGIIAIFPSDGKDVDPGKIRAYLSKHPYSIELKIVDTKIDMINADIGVSNQIAVIMKIGYVLLSLSWVSTLVIYLAYNLKMK